VEFAAAVDWGRAFAQLQMWPVNCSMAEIAEQTPRETFALWEQLNEWREMIAGIFDGVPRPREWSPPAPAKEFEPEPEPEPEAGRPPEVVTPAADFVAEWVPEPEPEEEMGEYAAPEVRKCRPDPRNGLLAVGFGGAGLGGHKCFERQPGEDDADPFSVPRGVVKDRAYVMCLIACERGMLQREGVPQGNRQAMQVYFDRMWETNSETYRAVLRAALDPDPAACREALAGLAGAGRLKPYRVHPGDAAALDEFVTRIRSCAAKRFGS
jgi:hypothetical protein